MLAVGLLSLFLADSWVEISAGLPVADNISTLAFGENSEELWLGTAQGRIFRSLDGGESYELLFNPLASEPIVEPNVGNLRASAVNDLSRGVNRDLPARERTERRVTDAAGSVRNDPRTKRAPLLSSLVRYEANEPVNISRIHHCDDYVFLATAQGLWRSPDNGVRFEKLNPGMVGHTPDVDWVSCDPTTKGHLIINTDYGILESYDFGDTFFQLRNPFPFKRSPQTVSFNEQGRLVALIDQRIFRERAPGHGGYEEICRGTGDSLPATKVKWAWYTGGKAFMLTQDGVMICDGVYSSRINDERLANQRIVYIWIDGDSPNHIYIATPREVFESTDGGQSLNLIFTAPTQRSIRRVRYHADNPYGLFVVTGGQIFKRVRGMPEPKLGAQRNQVLSRALDNTPLGEVIQASLGSFGLAPGQVAQVRGDLFWRAWMPQITARYAHSDVGLDFDQRDRGVQFQRLNDAGQNRWSVFALWNLGDFVNDPTATDEVWADLERLRRELTYRVQDNYTLWLRATRALLEPDLTLKQRIYYELTRREAASYLDQITGNRFASFQDDELVAALR